MNGTIVRGTYKYVYIVFDPDQTEAPLGTFGSRRRAQRFIKERGLGSYAVAIKTAVQ